MHGHFTNTAATNLNQVIYVGVGDLQKLRKLSRKTIVSVRTLDSSVWRHWLTNYYTPWSRPTRPDATATGDCY